MKIGAIMYSKSPAVIMGGNMACLATYSITEAFEGSLFSFCIF
jgi:hypothetical protein